MPSYSEFFWVAREVSVIEDHRPASGLLVSGGRNAERGMIALRVQEPTARREEASVKGNDLESLLPSEASNRFFKGHPVDLGRIIFPLLRPRLIRGFPEPPETHFGDRRSTPSGNRPYQI
jgi:hypothetical protein